LSGDASCINSQSTTINGDDDDDLFKEMNDILEMEPEKVVSLKEDSSNSSSNHTANESLNSSKKAQEINSIVAKEGPFPPTAESSSFDKDNKNSSPSTVSDIINSKSGDKRHREAMENDNDSEELFNKKIKLDTTRSKSPPIDPPTAQSTPIRPIRASIIESENKRLLPIVIEKEEEPDWYDEPDRRRNLNSDNIMDKLLVAIERQHKVGDKDFYFYLKKYINDMITSLEKEEIDEKKNIMK
jgi:hypothetical protein